MRLHLPSLHHAAQDAASIVRAVPYIAGLLVAPVRSRVTLWLRAADAAWVAAGDVYAEDDGCDCTELCSMGPTCHGGGLAGLPGSGCWRTAVGDGE